jgi:hypothetical protein
MQIYAIVKEHDDFIRDRDRFAALSPWIEDGIQELRWDLERGLLPQGLRTVDGFFYALRAPGDVEDGTYMVLYSQVESYDGQLPTFQLRALAKISL